MDSIDVEMLNRRMVFASSHYDLAIEVIDMLERLRKQDIGRDGREYPHEVFEVRRTLSLLRSALLDLEQSKREARVAMAGT